jgi:hypothetical protein
MIEKIVLDRPLAPGTSETPHVIRQLDEEELAVKINEIIDYLNK